MFLLSTLEYKEAQTAFRSFVNDEIVPYADQFDHEEYIPSELIEKLVQAEYWGAALPQENGGSGMDMITYGLLTETIGYGCASTRNLLAVQGMVSSAILKWGSDEQIAYWLPKMAAGEVVAAFALTEPEIGSDAKRVQVTATPTGSGYVLNGRKKWISFGQNASLFLVFAQCEGNPTAFLVERETPGFTSEPISGMMGFKASMLAELHLQDCYVPAENIVGHVGFGLAYVAATALSHGRYSTSWGAVGLAQACLEASLDYSSKRQQFGVYLKEHQLVRSMIADMITNIEAARSLCCDAGYFMQQGDPQAIMKIAVAKYFSSTTAVKAANDAVQIHGAFGCSNETSVQRYLRDAKIMEIIEGTTQIQQLLIASHGYQSFRS